MNNNCVSEIDINTPLTREEVIHYCLEQGTGIKYVDNGRCVEEEVVEWWLLEDERYEQKIECVRTNMDLIDFDEWQSLENILFGEESCDLPCKTAGTINTILRADLDVSALDIETPISGKRANELLHNIIDYLEVGENISTQISQLLKIGFKPHELRAMWYSENDITEVLNDTEENI